MLAKKFKVKKEAIPNILRRGMLVGGEILTLRILRMPEQSENHFSVIIAKKTIKTAVGRHANQRKLYDLIARDMGIMAPGYNVLIFPKTDLRRVDIAILQQELVKLFTKAGLMA